MGYVEVLYRIGDPNGPGGKPDGAVLITKPLGWKWGTAEELHHGVAIMDESEVPEVFRYWEHMSDTAIRSARDRTAKTPLVDLR